MVDVILTWHLFVPSLLAIEFFGTPLYRPSRNGHEMGVGYSDGKFCNVLTVCIALWKISVAPCLLECHGYLMKSAICCYLG
jgi:hypothetical protein